MTGPETKPGSQKKGKNVWDEIQKLRKEMTQLSMAMEDKAEFVELKKESQKILRKVEEVIGELHTNNDRIKTMSDDLLKNFVIPMYVGTWTMIKSKNCDVYLGDNWNEETEKIMSKDVAIAKIDDRIIVGTATDGVADDFSEEIELDKEVAGTTWYMNGTRLRTRCLDPKTKKVLEEVDRFIENGQMTVVNEADGISCTRVYKKLP